MKRYYKNNQLVSIKDLMGNIDRDTYTAQTIESLSRCFLETIIENRSNAVILVKIRETKNFRDLLNRLKYTDIKVYSYSENIGGFQNIKLNVPGMENDEFFVIIAERFSACLCWNNLSSEGFGLCEGFCSLNLADTGRITEYLQTVAYSKNFEKDLKQITQDRRNNEKFTTILRKIVSDLENRQRDLICANTELREFHEKSGENEKLASLNQLFSIAMHELRNPLGSINLHTEIISKKLEILNPENSAIVSEIQESTGLIKRTSEKLEKILSELLDFSKPLSLEKTELNIEEAVSEIINLIKPSYEDKNVGLVLKNFFDNNLLVNFDRAKLHQIIFNILKNALEVSEPGKKVEVLLTNEHDRIYLKVIDEGPGVPAEFREKIFEPYFTTKKEGTGLGLAQAIKILEAHEGDLYVDPKSINGTTFILSLPAAPIGVKSTAGQNL